MKKFTLIFLCTLLAGMYTYGQNLNTTQITLDGTAKAAFKKMKKYFKDHKGCDTKPIPVSLWINTATVDAITNLLNGELKPDGTKKADGVRIYFMSDGYKSEPNLNNRITFVSTTLDTKVYPSRPTRSQHRDYYEHSATFLNSGVKFEMSYITDNTNVNGAFLYQKNTPCTGQDSGPCYFLLEHTISCADAYKWVQNFSSGSINTFSEWFDLDTFNQLDTALHVANYNLDGLRIYAAKTTTDMKKGQVKNRHVFVIAPTTKNGTIHNDYYGCIEIMHVLDNGQLCPFNCN